MQLVNNTLDKAVVYLHPWEHPVIHLGRWCHCHWPGWIRRVKETRLISLMLRKCRSPDITAFEEFWGRLKNEMFYDCSWTGVSAEQFKEVLDDFINETRINLSRGGMSQVEFRRSLGLP